MTGDSPSEADELTAETHTRHVAVWDVPSAVDCGETYRIKVGVKCAEQCVPTDWVVEVRDPDGRLLEKTALGEEPWPGTTALHYAELELAAPEVEGLFTCQVVAPEVALPDAGREEAGGAQIAHGPASARFNVCIVPAPECRLTVLAVDKETQTPIEGATVVVHPYRSVTDAGGRAEVRVPRGAYRLFVSGRAYFPFRSDGEADADATIRAELDRDVAPSDAELWS